MVYSSNYPQLLAFRKEFSLNDPYNSNYLLVLDTVSMDSINYCAAINPGSYAGCGRFFPRKAIPGLCGTCYEYKEKGHVRFHDFSMRIHIESTPIASSAMQIVWLCSFHSLGDS